MKGHSSKLPYNEYDFVSALSKSINLNGYIHQREVKTDHGYADLVLSKLNNKKACLRLKHNQFSFIPSERYFSILRIIPDIEKSDSPISIQEIETKTNISKSVLRYKMIDFLVNNNYLKRVDGNFYYKINGWVPLTDEHIAIEAKLFDWKSGIKQALRYRSFAQKVYLALPSERIHLVDFQMLQQFNVGLISFNYNTNEVNISYECTSEDPWDIDRNNYVSEFSWAKLIGNHLKEKTSITVTERIQKILSLYNTKAINSVN